MWLPNLTLLVLHLSWINKLKFINSIKKYYYKLNWTRYNNKHWQYSPNPERNYSLMEKTDKCIHNYSNTYYGLREQYIYNAKEAQKRDNSMRQGKLSEVSEVYLS